MFFIDKKLGLYGVVAILIGFYPVTGYIQMNPFAATAPEGSPKILSYNVRLFNLYNWSENIETRNKIFQFLHAEDAEIMCFQEFYFQENSTQFPTKDTLKNLFKGYHWHEKYTHEMRHQQYFGVVTMSEFPIVNRGEVPFDNDPNNFCIYSDIVYQHDTMRIFNTHIGSIRLQQSDYSVFDEDKDEHSGRNEQAIIDRLIVAFRKRELQALKILDAMEASPYPVLICGDFNDTPFSYVYRQFHKKYEDAFRVSGSGLGRTYIGKAPSFRIDYIFHDPSILTYEFTTHDVSLSDHRPISAYFSFDD